MAKMYYLFDGEFENMGLSIFDIANTFLSMESMTHKKLQKLCYYAYAWFLALERRRLFSDANFQAWIHGPVSPELYSKFRGFGWTEIERCAMPQTISCNLEVQGFLSEIFRIYGGLDGDQLEELTHSEDPWKAARQGLQPWQASTNIISDQIMADFYLEEYERSQND